MGENIQNSNYIAPGAGFEEDAPSSEDEDINAEMEPDSEDATTESGNGVGNDDSDSDDSDDNSSESESESEHFSSGASNSVEGMLAGNDQQMVDSGVSSNSGPNRASSSSYDPVDIMNFSSSVSVGKRSSRESQKSVDNKETTTSGEQQTGELGGTDEDNLDVPTEDESHSESSQDDD